MYGLGENLRIKRVAGPGVPRRRTDVPAGGGARPGQDPPPIYFQQARFTAH